MVPEALFPGRLYPYTAVYQQLDMGACNLYIFCSHKTMLSHNETERRKGKLGNRKEEIEKRKEEKG
jgi:hypothetical protein